MNTEKLVILLMPVLILSACSTTRKSFSPTECNEAASFDRGFSEGKSGLDPDTEYSYQCREDLREAVRKGYRQGHDKGVVEYKALMAQWNEQQKEFRERSSPSAQRPEAQTPTYICEITHSGHGFQSEGKTLRAARTEVVSQCAESWSRTICNSLPRCKQNTVATQPRAIYCKATVFTREYEAFGPTELETRSTLRAQCSSAEKSEFFCKDDRIVCKPNH